MKIWHLQLHKDERLSDEKLREILSDKSVIGLGEGWKNKRGNWVKDPTDFREKMDVNDIVLIRNTITPIALVKVVGNAFLEKNIDGDLDWFPLRRKIEVLGWYGEVEKTLLTEILQKNGKRQIQALGTLTLCKTQTATKEFIEAWLRKLV